MGARKEYKRKKLGHFQIEHIDNLCILTLVVNPKKYLELFEDKNLNKKHKGIKKGSSGLGFENISQRIKSLVSFDTFKKPPHYKKKLLGLLELLVNWLKHDFTQQIKRLFKRNTKDIILEGGWIMK